MSSGGGLGWNLELNYYLKILRFFIFSCILTYVSSNVANRPKLFHNFTSETGFCKTRVPAVLYPASMSYMKFWPQIYFIYLYILLIYESQISIFDGNFNSRHQKKSACEF